MKQSLRTILPIAAPILLLLATQTETLLFLPLNLSGTNVLSALLATVFSITATLALLCRRSLQNPLLTGLALTLVITATLSFFDLFLATTAYQLPPPAGWISFITPICFSITLLLSLLFPTQSSLPNSLLSTIGILAAALISSITLFIPNLFTADSVTVHRISVYLPLALYCTSALTLIVTVRWQDKPLEYLLLSAILLLATSQWLYAADNGPTAEQSRNFLLLLNILSISMLAAGLLIERSNALRQKGVRKEISTNEFLAVISHEIRTPLNAILGIAELLSSTSLNGSRRQQIEILSKSGSELKLLLDDILDLTELNSNRLELNYQSFNLQRALQQLIFELKPLADRSGVRLCCVFLPGCPTNIVSDQRRLMQIISYMLNRSLLQTRQGEIRLAIGMNEPRSLSITLQDSSESYPSGRAEPLSIERDSRQVDDYLSQHRVNIKKSVCDKLISLLCGTLENHRSAERLFSCELKLPVTAATTSRYRGEFSQAGTILLISPTPDKAQQSLLQTHGARIEHLDSTEQALQSVTQDAAHYGLIIFNHCPPEHDGFSFVKSLKEQQPDSPPVMLLAAEYSINDYLRAKHSGATGYARLPLPHQDLLTMAEHCIARFPDSPEERPLVIPQNQQNLSPLAKKLPRLQGHVLVVEDVEANQFVVCGMLDSLGLRFSLANNGAEAVEQWLRQKPDLVLMDLRMPIMDGFEATRQIRAMEEKDGSKVPIIALTADAMSESYRKALSCGIDDLLIKPLDRLSLNRILTQHLPDMELAYRRGSKVSTASAPKHNMETQMEMSVLEELSQNVQLPVDQLATMYLTELKGLRQDLADSLEGRNDDEVKRTAHSIKGAALSIGATELADIARQLETIDIAAINLAELDEAMTLTEKTIQHHLGYQPA
ncbi:response regulator [Marinobacterium jannaschii]|uniref:response regulator n=1 Tax=Marinobacterium jannaschii TaxID=64970 RepID=UPI0004806B04|nr:hybrid sensor histidine kinase/response regulator [Marinobacterium jannaschii]